MRLRRRPDIPQMGDLRGIPAEMIRGEPVRRANRRRLIRREHHGPRGYRFLKYLAMGKRTYPAFS